MRARARTVTPDLIVLLDDYFRASRAGGGLEMEDLHRAGGVRGILEAYIERRP